MLEVVDFGVAAETRLQKSLRTGRPINMRSPSGQDSTASNLERTVFAIADGVASDVNAAVAAQYVTREFVEAFSGRALSSYYDALDIIQDGLLERLHKIPEMVQATTTLTGLVLSRDNHASYLHLGDSQLLLRRDDHITEITSEQVLRGHSLTNYLGISGTWPPGHERHPLTLNPHPNRASITGTGAEWGSIALTSGDRLILATDGVLGSAQHERRSERAWLEQTKRRLGAQAVADMLLRMSPKNDDSTVIVVDIDNAVKTP